MSGDTCLGSVFSKRRRGARTRDTTTPKVQERKRTHMKFDIVRAWKDEAYRQSLSEEELSL
ncbi:mersacidin/lichenicidin family type 2 lantibiotic, partial [Thermogemmatispora sp.]|uniref:mersacidin/lichenicidin family type 2 lantibiotic n=1 Tax=Thermogemmatispora sp. TaxID=1968838 RepID=UPI002ACBE213